MLLKSPSSPKGGTVCVLLAVEGTDLRTNSCQRVKARMWAQDVAQEVPLPLPPLGSHFNHDLGRREQCQALIDSAVSFLNLVSLN